MIDDVMDQQFEMMIFIL